MNRMSPGRKRLLVFGLGLLMVLQIVTLAWPNIQNEIVKQQTEREQMQTQLGMLGSHAYGQGGDTTADPLALPEGETTTTTTAPPKKVIIPKLINTTNVMEAEYKPTNLVEIGDSVKGTSTLQINATVLAAYKVMYADMKETTVTIPSIISAYRSYEKQKQLYDKKVAQYGPGQKVTAAPGTSEHQYSACIDLSTDGTCQNNFGELDIGIWIAENSYKYGFVVRYPTGKKEITGINHEPWHIRYVGVEHATYMYQNSLCLEEYVDYLRKTYPDAVDEQSPDDFPPPRFANDLGM
ncbi:MAG: D-alanyl-D-alanine carboxypeptidase family protein [Ruminococcaceae bacterium]|nr:D-alanyl-D-alanine carboxypeptidase family protein [Oscillospiraceae bacterium]